MVRIFSKAVLTLGLILSTPISAEQFPQRPVTFVVPFAAGGLTDTTARLLGAEMSTVLGQSVVVENRGGAGGYIGSGYVARAQPDGYTMLLATMGTMAASATLSPKLSYDPPKDFRAVRALFISPNLLVARKDAPFDSLESMVKYAKDNPGKINFATNGVGTASHLAAELFMQMTDVKMTHVPYQGSAPALTDLVAGRIDIMFDYPVSSGPHIESGSIVPLAYFSSERTPAYPNLPTIAEKGLGKQVVDSWTAIMVPAGTPDHIVERLAKAADVALKSDRLQQHLTRNSERLLELRMRDMDAFLVDQIGVWGKVIKAANITIPR